MTEVTDRFKEARPRRFRPYPEYRESGVDWLSEIPAHWEAKRLRFVVETSITKKEVRDLDPETEISFVPMEAVREYGGIDLHSTKALSEVAEGYTYFRNGDVIVAKITPCFENGKGALASDLCSDIGFGTTELHVLRPSFHVDPRFLLYLTFSDHFRRTGTGSMYGAGGQKRISDDFIRDFRHPIPSLREQCVIADFLDHETATIDALVARKERLIELLQEKRTALITRAVTRGLDPSVPMKDSGVERLGELPEHWVTWKATHGFHRIGSGTTPKSDNPEYYDGDISWVTTSELRETVITDTVRKVTATAVREYPTLRMYPKGTLLFAMYGATIGRLGILGIAATVNQACAALAEPLHLATRFVYYWLQMRRPTLIGLSAGGGQPNLSQDDLRQLRIPAPPLDEQRAIATFLDRETAKIDVLIAKVHEAIDHLKEFRTALISGAVTGKIDVREAMPR